MATCFANPALKDNIAVVKCCRGCAAMGSGSILDRYRRLDGFSVKPSMSKHRVWCLRVGAIYAGFGIRQSAMGLYRWCWGSIAGFEDTAVCVCVRVFGSFEISWV